MKSTQFIFGKNLQGVHCPVKNVLSKCHFRKMEAISLFLHQFSSLRHLWVQCRNKEIASYFAKMKFLKKPI